VKGIGKRAWERREGTSNHWTGQGKAGSRGREYRGRVATFVTGRCRSRDSANGCMATGPGTGAALRDGEKVNRPHGRSLPSGVKLPRGVPLGGRAGPEPVNLRRGEGREAVASWPELPLAGGRSALLAGSLGALDGGWEVAVGKRSYRRGSDAPGAVNCLRCGGRFGGRNQGHFANSAYDPGWRLAGRVQTGAARLLCTPHSRSERARRNSGRRVPAPTPPRSSELGGDRGCHAPLYLPAAGEESAPRRSECAR
jgi:hypothetical protein